MVTPFARSGIMRAAHGAPWVGIEELAGAGAIMVLAPHPDDESLGCGAAIAAASRKGRRIIITVLTDGAGSHPNSRTHPPARLAALRERELRRAVYRLTCGKGRVIMLRYPDGNIPNSPREQVRIIARLLAIVDEENVSAIWTTWEEDPHCDHQIAASLSKQVVEFHPEITLWRFPIWGRFTQATLAAMDRLVRFETAAYWRIKAAAIAAHRSQMTRLIADDPQGFILAREKRRHFQISPEYFIIRQPNV